MKLAYTYDRRQPLYHGTKREFEKPKLNGIGILWLTPDPKAAEIYAGIRNTTGSGFLWDIRLKPSAKIVDLSDLTSPIIREFYKMVSDIRRSTFGPIDEKDWPKFADFGLLEGYGWAVRFLKSKRVHGATCADTAASVHGHDSVALFNLNAIDSLEKKALTGLQV